MKVVNIIPTYNEKENVGIMLEALLKIEKEHPQYQFLHLVADDNSPDGTAKIVEKYQKKYPQIKLITGPKKGLGHALLRSYRYAVEDLEAEAIIPNDADLSFDPHKIPDLLKKIDEGFDVVVASRHVGEGGTEGWSLFRKLNHWVSNIFFATYVAGIKEVKDHNGNFKAIRVKGVLDRVDFDKLLEKIKIRGFVIQTYILYELSKYTKKFTEVPVIFKFRERGEAKIGKKYLKSYLRDTFEYMKLCVLIRLERSQRFVKYAVVGFTSYGVTASFMEIFYRLGLSPGLAASAASEIAIIFNFTVNNLWTFADKKIASWRKIPIKFIQFNLTSLGAVLLQGLVVGILALLFGDQWRQIYLIIAVGFFVIPYNYFMYTRVIWKAKKPHA
jgi:dolichol-phosphate mannosyltransferase